jgi:hypothetical protein
LLVPNLNHQQEALLPWLSLVCLRMDLKKVGAQTQLSLKQARLLQMHSFGMGMRVSCNQ